MAFSLELSLVRRFVVGCCSIRCSQHVSHPASGTMLCTLPISRKTRKFIEVEELRMLDFRWHRHLGRIEVKWNMKIRWNSEWWTKQITNSIISMLSIECNWWIFLHSHLVLQIHAREIILLNQISKSLPFSIFCCAEVLVKLCSLINNQK